MGRLLPAYVLFGVFKHFVSLRWLARRAWCQPNAPRDREAERRIVERVLRLSQLAGLRDRDCLQRSLLLYRVLSRAGADPTLMVGFLRRNDRIQGHAWVTVDGYPVIESEPNILHFSPAVSFGSRGAQIGTSSYLRFSKDRATLLRTMPLRRVVCRFWVSALRSTLVVDRGFLFFDRLRAKAVLASASDGFYDNYNDITYGRQAQYRAGSEGFRSRLFPFEEHVIARHFPPPPGTVLIGAAGGGREALALARSGHRVIAFEPARLLATSLADSGGELPVETFVGRYEKLPLVHSLTDPSVVLDLRSRAPFAAAILGWGSFSHLRSDESCINTLRKLGQLTRGPILVSYFSVATFGPNTRVGGRFSMGIGYYRTFSGADIAELAQSADLHVIELNEEDAHPYAVLQVPSTKCPPRRRPG